MEVVSMSDNCNKIGVVQQQSCPPVFNEMINSLSAQVRELHGLLCSIEKPYKDKTALPEAVFLYWNRHGNHNNFSDDY